MSNTNDMRLNVNIFKNMIGRKFIKYRCDPFVYTNTVTAIIGLYIDKKIYKLVNEQEYTRYFNTKDDIAVWNIFEVEDSEIHSYFSNIKQIDTPINETINKITLVNEFQSVKINGTCYNLWVTRSIIFNLENKDICFEKDPTSFSEEIEIKRGHNLIKDYPKRNDYFLGEWIEGISPSIKTEFITIE